MLIRSSCWKLMVIAATVLLTNGTTAVGWQSKNPSATPSDKCSALVALNGKSLSNQTTVITSAALIKSGSTPEHCEVLGKLNERVGFNSQHYVINFHMRLPTNWNRNFFFQAGANTNGNLGNAMGNLWGAQPRDALSLGYAVVSQDAGHSNSINNDPNLNGTQTFGFDPQA